MNSDFKSLPVEDLRQLIRYHEHKYYVVNQPQISDHEFDQLMAQLGQLEAVESHTPPADSPTQRERRGAGGKRLPDSPLRFGGRDERGR